MKNKSTFIFITALLSLLVIYALVTNVLLPVFTKNQITEESSVYLNNKSEDQKPSKKKKTAIIEKEGSLPDSLKASSRSQARDKLFGLKKEEKFLQSKLSLVEDDSMYLVLDISKKIAVLELKGVSLHEGKILNYTVSNTIKNQPQDALLNWISKPFFLKEDSASIPKISFIIKIAPKDSIEANQNEALPEPPKRGDVYAVLNFERGLRLIIRQSEKPEKEGEKIISRLRWNYTRDEISKSLYALMHLDRELAVPTIEIILPKADATILYRALPYRPKLILKL
jgi:hypothetical protein